MKNIKTKFEGMIRQLDYNQIKLSALDIEKVKEWSYENMPGVVKELETKGWDLSNDNTWSENTFTPHVLNWYDKKVALFLTASLFDFNLFNKVINYPKFRQFRKDFKLDIQATVLINPIIFLEPEDLDVLFISFDFSKGYSSLDYSHFDDEDELDETYVDDWGWLEDDDTYDSEWDTNQVARAYRETVYSYTELEDE